MSSEYQVRLEMIRVTRIVANQGLISSSDGNLQLERLTSFGVVQIPRNLFENVK